MHQKYEPFEQRASIFLRLKVIVVINWGLRLFQIASLFSSTTLKQELVCCVLVFKCLIFSLTIERLPSFKSASNCFQFVICNDYSAEYLNNWSLELSGLISDDWIQYRTTGRLSFPTASLRLGETKSVFKYLEILKKRKSRIKAVNTSRNKVWAAKYTLYYTV